MSRHYVTAYHQIRVLALLSLIVSHALSFSNQFTRLALEKLPGFTGVAFISTFGVLFIPLAGTSFRLAFADRIKGHRIYGDFNRSLFAYLIALVVIETFKDYLVYRDWEYLLHWNFLKTLLAGLLLIEIVGRIHIFALAVVSILITANADALTAWCESQIATPYSLNEQLLRWNAVHWTFLIAIAIPTLWLWSLSLRSGQSRLLKLWITLATLSILFLSLSKLAVYVPSIETYFFIKNWFWLGLTGQSPKSTLYPGLAWIPSVLNGFLLVHFAKEFKSTLERHEQMAFFALLFLAIFSYWLFQRDVIRPENLLNVWDIPAFHRASLAAEFFKVCSLANLFSVLVLMNRKFRIEGSAWITHLSQGSFLVYLLCTSLAVWLARVLSPVPSMYGAAALAALTIGLLSVALTESVAWIRSKRIRLRLVKA